MSSANRTASGRHGGWKTWRERFANGYTANENGCHVWQRSKNSRGYGVIYMDGKLRLAHRVAFYVKHDRWPHEGYVTDHVCENKACVNADHLRELENWQNIRRAYPTTDPKVRRKRERNRLAQSKIRPPVSPNYTPLYEGGESNNLV